MCVVGFDNLLYAAVCAPPLTTVAMPMEAGGRAAVDLLLAGIDGAEDGTGPYRELSTNLIVRATTAAAHPSAETTVSVPAPGTPARSDFTDHPQAYA
jgi:DNA-binding LacI/PurR family transcriptional regulator